MSCLCYCVCHYPSPRETASVRGVDDHAVYQLSHRQLSVIVSQVKPGELLPNPLRIKAYERVVESYHRRGTVIPLRYGSVASEESQVIQSLEGYGAHFEALLRELSGCVEMGLRVLLPSGPWSAVIPGGSSACREEAWPPPPDPEAAPERPGLTYLTARKAHYAQQDRWTQDYRRLADYCQAQFSGLVVKSKIEAPSERLPLLSLFFLIPRESIEPFRQIFKRLCQFESARFLLSGPWPPYNFVTGGPRLI